MRRMKMRRMNGDDLCSQFPCSLPNFDEVDFPSRILKSNFQVPLFYSFFFSLLFCSFFFMETPPFVFYSQTQAEIFRDLALRQSICLHVYISLLVRDVKWSLFNYPTKDKIIKLEGIVNTKI